MVVNILCMWDWEGDCECVFVPSRLPVCVCICQLTLSRLGLSVLPVAVVTSVRPSFRLHSLCPFLCAAGSGPVERHRHDCVIRCQIESNRAFIVAWRHLTLISLLTSCLWHSVIDSMSCLSLRVVASCSFCIYECELFLCVTPEWRLSTQKDTFHSWKMSSCPSCDVIRSRQTARCVRVSADGSALASGQV